MWQGNERILVVDDDAPMREALSKGLGQVGYQCVTAASADDAEQVLQREKFALMLLDIGMPGKTGLAFLPEVTVRCPDMAIVMLTGHDQLDTAVLAMREGADDYLTKPVTLGLLLQRVEKALSRRAILLEKQGEPQQTYIPEEGSAPGEESAQKAAATEDISPGGDNLADVAIDSLADIAQGIGTAATEYIKTGERQLDDKMGGGLPHGSLTLIEGSSSTGKSVLCQHLVYGTLMTTGGVAFFSSEFTFQSLLTQMQSIGLDARECPPGAQLTVFPLSDPLPDEDTDPMLGTLALAMESLPGNLEFIVVDAITNLASYSGDRSILSFFASCKRLCAAGRTIVVVAHSAAFDDRMSARLRALCDGYLSLRVENAGDKLLNVLEVRKILNAEKTTGNVVFFEVQPGMGIRVNAFSRARV